MRRDQWTSFATRAQDRPVPEPRLRIGVLGPLVLTRDGEVVKVAPAMVRNLLALLALHPGGTVTRDQIVSALWPDDPPATCANLIHVYISRLRAQVRSGPDEPDPIVRGEYGGYQLRLPPGSIDLGRFDAALAGGRAAVRAGDTATALVRYAEAVRCWRGPVLSDVHPRFAELPASAAAQQRRIEATVEYAGLCATAGQHSAAADALRQVAPSAPLHEGICAALMVALAGLGDRAAALAEFTAMRKRLREELGIDPGTELQAVNMMMITEGGLEIDDSPAPVPAARPKVTVAGTPASPPVARRSSWWSRPVSVAAAGLAVVLIVVAGWGAFGGSSRRPSSIATARPVDQGLVFAPSDHRWYWRNGPSLGVTTTGDQWASAYVSGLGDKDHNAGFLLRAKNNPQTGRDEGILVAFFGNGWRVEGNEEGDNGASFPVATEGRLVVSITAAGVITMTFNGAQVMIYKLADNPGDRGITPTIWQSDTGAVRMTQISSNAG